MAERPLQLAYQRSTGEVFPDHIEPTPFYWIAGLLAAAFFLPEVILSGSFTNIAVVADPSLPMETRAFFAYPLIGAAVAYFLARQRPPARGGAVLGIGVIPFVVLLLPGPIGSAVATEFAGLGLDPLRVAVPVLAWMGMLVGLWVYIHRPAHRIGPTIAAASAALHTVHLLLPIEIRQIKVSAPAALAPIMAFTEGGDMFVVVSTVFALAGMAIAIAASVLCFRLAADRMHRYKNGESAFRLAWVSVVVASVPLLAAAALVFGSNCATGATIAKLAAWGLGLLLPLPLGLADLIIGTIPQTPDWDRWKARLASR